MTFPSVGDGAHDVPYYDKFVWCPDPWPPNKKRGNNNDNICR